MEIGVIGAGAMGGLFGGLLADSGVNVHLFDVWEEHVRRIDEDGLAIEFPDRGNRIVPLAATTDPSEIDVVDVAIVFTKCYDVDAAMTDAAPMYDESTAVVTLQNGLSHVDVLLKYVDSEQLYYGPTMMGSEVVEPGRVRLQGWGKSKLGGADEQVAQGVAQAFSRAGMETTAVADPRPHLWNKQFVSVGIKPVAALTELTHGGFAGSEDTWHVVETLMEEAMAVAEAKGIERIVDDPVAETYELCRTKMTDAKSSMLEDIEKERPTEIDYVNGAIAAYGAEESVETPYNRLVTALVSGKERGYLSR